MMVSSKMTSSMEKVCKSWLKKRNTHNKDNNPTSRKIGTQDNSNTVISKDKEYKLLHTVNTTGNGMKVRNMGKEP